MQSSGNICRSYIYLHKAILYTYVKKLTKYIYKKGGDRKDCHYSIGEVMEGTIRGVAGSVWNWKVLMEFYWGLLWGNWEALHPL